MSKIEVRVRAFYKNEDDLNVVPAAIIVVDPAKYSDDFVKNAADVLAKVTGDSPLGKLRPMTKEEIDRYRKDEEEDDDSLFSMKV
jgi:hypothetical protein